MKSNTLVSIIVPVYGTAKYLPECIESICNQTYSNLQIILVDDQSPDRCPQICDDFAIKDNRIIVIHQKNTGVSGARNTGIRNATGEYIMFVDSDDILETCAVKNLLSDAYKYGADIVSSLPKIIDENGNVLSNNEDNTYAVFSDYTPLSLSLKGEQNTDSVWAKLFKSEFIKDIFFEEGKNINEDGFYIFQCFVRKPILVNHNICVYQYRIRKNSCSRQLFSDKYLSMLYFLNKKKEIIDKYFSKLNVHAYNMQVRTNLQLLDLLCSTNDKKYKELQKQCINTVCKLNKYHKPINKHHKKLAWIVRLGLYPIYKVAVRFKYYR